MSRPVPTLRGWVVGGAGVVALVFAGALARSDLMFVGLMLVLAPVAAGVAIAVDRPALSVARSYVPDSVPAGEAAEVRLVVRNRWSRPTPGFAWVDTLPPEVAGVSKRSFPSLAAATGTGVTRGAESATLRYSARGLRRGAHLLGPLRVERTDPFGLARCAYDVGERKPLVVTPRVTALAAGSADDARGEGTLPELVRHSIPSTDEVIPRDYRPGDPLRRVQWRATARQGRIMVRQEEQLSNPDAVILLDTVSARAGASRAGASRAGSAQAGSTPAGSSRAFDRAVELAASVAVHLLDLGYLVGVYETGERQLGGSYELPGGDQLLLGQLATLTQTADADGDVVGRVARALRSGGGSPTFLILVDGGEASWREFVMIRGLADPAVAFLATPAARAAEPWLDAAGWVCVPLDERTDASAAWSRATAASARHAPLSDSGQRRV